MFKHYLIVSFLLCYIANTPLMSAIYNTEDINLHQFQKEKERIDNIKKNLPKKNTIIIKNKNNTDNGILIDNESPCFDVKKINLVGDSNDTFKKYVDIALKKVEYKNQCLGQKNIKIILEAVNNEILKDGYITTKVIIPSQNLKTQILNLYILPGKIDKIIINDKNDLSIMEKVTLFFASPLKKENILNLRDIEQSLENMSKLTTIKTDIQIAPSKKEGYSDIVINQKKQFIPFSANLSLDDSGSDNNGKYQGGISFFAENLLGINEILSFGYTKDIFKKKSTSIENDDGQKEEKSGGSANRYISFSFPFRYWQFNFLDNKYKYDQAVAGANQVYNYSGTSKSTNATLTYLLYRNKYSKYNIYLKGWERLSKNYIEDAEVENQKRKTAGYEVGLYTQYYFGTNSVSLRGSYKKGTGARGSIKAPEEEFGEGTSRMEIYNLNLSFSARLMKDFPLDYDTSLFAQWNGTPLTIQDYMSIGGRNSVRGFDGDLTLSSERGWYFRNTISHPYFQNHSIYIGLDAGRVSGPNAKNLSGQSLIGSALGIKGAFNLGNSLSYDIFLGTPIKKPKNFKTKKVSFGFSINYSF